MGAHSNFKLKGQEHNAKIAFALYDILAADAATAEAEDAVDAVDAAAKAAVDVKSCIFCCIRKGIDADRPMGIPWIV
jgi:sulfur relay (sulfurtransferase) complex TusBCD TusD component (DsrE family)